MSLDRTLILKSPGSLTHNGANIHSEADITAVLITEYFDVPTSGFGVVDRRILDRRVEVSLTPKMWNDLTKLFPWATKSIGDTLFGGADLPLVITPRNGAPLTIANVVVTQMPSLMLSGGKPILGAMKFTGLCANAANPALASSYYSFGTVASGVALPNFDLTKVPNARYTATYGATAIRHQDGVSVDFAMGLDPDKADGEPTLNYRLTSLDASAKLTPVGMTEAAYATLIGFAGDIGTSPNKAALVIAGRHYCRPRVTLANCFVRDTGSANYGATTNRTGQLEFATIRTLTAGALNALWTFDTTP
jgi:hypothetical protein